MLDLFVPTKSSSHREKKVSDLMRKVIAEIVVKGDLPPINDSGKILIFNVPITVTFAKMSPDLKICYVYIMPLGGIKKEETLHYFQKASGYIRKMIGPKIHLKSTPEIKFFLDRTFDEAKKIDAIIETISTDVSIESSK